MKTGHALVINLESAEKALTNTECGILDMLVNKIAEYEYHKESQKSTPLTEFQIGMDELTGILGFGVMPSEMEGIPFELPSTFKLPNGIVLPPWIIIKKK